MLGFGAALILSAAVWVAPVACLDLGGVDFIFSFGDSWSATGWDPARGLSPVVGQLVETSSGGNTWIQYLAASTNAPNTWYDFAAYGAVLDNDIVRWNETQPPSVVEQVASFKQYFTPGSSKVPWSSGDTLFTVFIGVNDVGATLLSEQDFPPLVPKIFEQYQAQVGKLYAMGARRFLIMNVPPTENTPEVKSYGPAAVEAFATNITLFNAALSTFVGNIPSLYPGAVVTLFDTHALLTTILSDVAAFGLEPSVKDEFCLLYSFIRDHPSIVLEYCKFPLSKYVWYDHYHPTFTIHKILADPASDLMSISECDVDAISWAHAWGPTILLVLSLGLFSRSKLLKKRNALGTLSPPVYGPAYLPSFVRGVLGAIRLGKDEDTFLTSCRRDYGPLVYLPWPMSQHLITSASAIQRVYDTPSKVLSFVPLRKRLVGSVFGSPKAVWTNEAMEKDLFPGHARALQKSKLDQPLHLFNEAIRESIADLEASIDASNGELEIDLAEWAMVTFFDAATVAMFGPSFLGETSKEDFREAFLKFDLAFPLFASGMVPTGAAKLVPPLAKGLAAREELVQVFAAWVARGMPGVEDGLVKDAAASSERAGWSTQA
ncbi:hypothetical protein RQP46_008939 [Phenoliferia psychrophenolica]